MIAFLKATELGRIFAVRLWMEINVIQKEYFRLLTNLNRSNKIKNEKTNLKFQVVKATKMNIENLDAILSTGQNITIATRFIGKRWIETNYSGLYNLEEYIVLLLNENRNLDIGDYTEIILQNLFPK